MTPNQLPKCARKFLWRMGRRVYAFARGELANDPRSNGEYWLLDRILARDQEGFVLVDVGANRGDWTARALERTRAPGSIHVHAFEPCTAARELLRGRLAGKPGTTIHAEALSDRAGESTFYSPGGAAGTSSMHPESGGAAEPVRVTTLDDFFAAQSISRADMVKIDAEGFDFLVLLGAQRLLQEGRLEVIQFEYNWRWLLNRRCLRDVFELIRDRPYTLGKLVGNSIEFHDSWHFELDRFFENNYVLVRNDNALRPGGSTMRFDSCNTAAPR